MTAYPGNDFPPPAQQPPAGYPPAPAQAEQKSGKKKWLGVAGGVVVAGAVGAFSLTGGFGGDPKAGDCVDMTSDTEFDVVDCGADEAEAKIAGIDDQGLTSSEFDKAPMEEICTDFASTEYAIWSGDIFTEPGSIYCLESL